MESKYIPIRAENFLSRIVLGYLNTDFKSSYEEMCEILSLREKYNFNIDSFLEEILKDGDISNEEYRLIEKVWGLKGDFPYFFIPKKAQEALNKLHNSKKVKEKLLTLISNQNFS